MALVLGDTDVELISTEKELKTINKGFSIDVSLDSPVRNIKLAKIQKETSLPYVDYLGYSLDSVQLYRKLSKLEEDDPEEIWGVVFEDKLLDISDCEKEVFGLAIDIGTTGISYYLIDLSTGKIIEKVSSLNPQTQYGGDVLTRITYCMENPDGALKLQELLVEVINSSIKNLLGSLNKKEDIYHIMISANTTMVHLLLGISPVSLARSPYRPIFLNTKELKAKEIGLDVNDQAIVSLIPAASSYVGGDIVSGIMASNFKNNEEALFIDIGTNGEMAVLKSGKIISTSTAAGPALEGMNIECGCRAEIGLEIEMISKVYIAGSFGYHVNPHNIKRIGLIPKGFNGEIVFLGNTSLEGARLALINKECFKDLDKIKEDMEVIELSLKKNFQDVFVSQLNF